MVLRGDDAEYQEAIRFWEGQSDTNKRIILQTLVENSWDFEGVTEEYGSKIARIPLSVLQAEYKRLNLTPRRLEKEFRDPLKATPLKNTLKRLSQTCTAEEAIAELVDNVFDNFARKRHERTTDLLEIGIHFLSREGEHYDEIILRENSGGVRNDELLPLVRLGDSATAGARTIGAWGQGSKIACFALADEIEIFTHHPAHRPVCIHFPDGWLKEEHPRYKDWEVKVYEAEDVPSGTTVFRFCNLKTTARTADLTAIKKYLERIYSYKIQDWREQGTTIDIRLEDTLSDVSYEIEPVFTVDILEEERGFCWFPDYAPLEVTHVLESETPLGEKIEVKVRMVCGILSDSKSDLGGVYMYGNKRLFTPKPETDERVGYGLDVQGRRGKIQKYRPSLYRLLTFVFFESEEQESEYIPWAAPLKNRYNPSNVFHDEIIQILYRIVYPYSLVCEGLEREMLPFFSKRWDALGRQEKKNLVESFFGGDVNPEEVVKYHIIEGNLDNLRQFPFEQVKGISDLPFGQVKSSTVKKFLEKVKDEKFNVGRREFFLAFFSGTVNRLVGEGVLDIDLPAPDPDHINMEYIESCLEQMEQLYESGTIKLEMDEKEKLQKKLNLPEEASVAEIIDALAKKELGI